MGRFNQTHRITVQPTITAGAYSAGDVVGGLLTFDMLGTGGSIRSLIIADRDDEKAAGTLYLYRDYPTVIADNGAWSMADADAARYIGNIAVAATDYDDSGGQSQAELPRLDIPFDVRQIYGYFVCSGTPTYTATSDLSFILVAWID